MNAKNTTSASPDSTTAINAQFLTTALAHLPVSQVDVFKEIDSTNTFLLNQEAKPNTARFCLAEMQTAGRGRRGNQWQSAPQRNIMMSMSWGFDAWPPQMSALSLAVGIGVAQTLRQLYAIDAKIKWPNDILVDGKKIAGILIESSGNEGSGCMAVIGLGLNVHQPNWPIQSDYPWVDLHSLQADVDRNRLAAELSKALVMVCRAFSIGGFTPMASAWNQLAAYLNCEVSLSKTDESLFGILRGVNADGALLLEHAGQVHEITNSDYSLRLA